MRKKSETSERKPPPVRMRNIPPHEFGDGPLPPGMRVLSVLYWVGAAAVIAIGMWFMAGAPLP